MKRERKRADWPQLIYKYWAKPTELPPWFWKYVDRQDHAWNTLVDHRNGILEKTKDLSKEDRKPFWVDFFKTCAELIKNSEITWEEKDELFQRFMTAHSTAMKKGLPLRRRTSENRQKILLIHRFSGGGLPIEQVFKNTGWRLSLNSISDEFYKNESKENRRKRLTTGKFGLSRNEILEFRTNLSRPLPPGAILKKVYWIGKFGRIPPNTEKLSPRIPRDGWTYSLQFVLEIPPRDIPIVRHGLVAGLNLGWRVRDDQNYIRIGYLFDSAGKAFELRLPLHREESHARKGLRKHLGDKKLYDDYEGLTDLRSMIGVRTQILKDHLLDVLDEDWLQNMEKKQQRGLLETLNFMREQEYNGPGREELEEWATTILQYEWIYYRQNLRLNSEKIHAYWNIATWLARRYNILTWDGDTSLKKMAENAWKNPILNNANRYRHYAALSELRQRIKVIASKYPLKLINGNTVHNTTTCFICNEQVEFDAFPEKQKKQDLILECPNGHRWDQDQNASINHTYNSIASAPEHNLVVQTVDNGVEIPHYLRRFIVPVVPEALGVSIKGGSYDHAGNASDYQ